MGLEGITPERFSARLKEWRERKDLSMDDLAKLTGISKTTIHRYETTGRMAKVCNAVALARALGIAFNYLIGFIDDPYDIEVKELTQVYKEMDNGNKHQFYEYGVYLLDKQKDKRGEKK